MISAMQQLSLRCSIPALFVTGTDTGVGKTRVACALIAAWRRAGRRVGALKPIETGCAGPEASLRAADGELLARAAELDPALVCPVRFAAPASPDAAASLAGRAIDWSRIEAAIARLAETCDAIVVEGAGGLLVPIDAEHDMADLAAAIGGPVLVVARSSLGTVNHTLLTLEAAARRGLAVAGVVLNRLAAEPGIDEPTNPAAIAARSGAALRGTLPYLAGSPAPAELGEIAARNLDLDGIWRAFAAR
jgi:dethiobiotin synthetase